MDQCNAQMAELVDALVSNTNECKFVPVRPRLWVPSGKYKNRSMRVERFFAFCYRLIIFVNIINSLSYF